MAVAQASVGVWGSDSEKVKPVEFLDGEDWGFWLLRSTDGATGRVY